MALLPLPVHAYSLDARSASSARLVNVYAEQGPRGDKAPIILRSATGVRSYVTLTGGCRGIFGSSHGVYAVAGNKLYNVTYTAVEIGTIAGTGRVTFAENSGQIVISADHAGYVWDGVTLTKITDTDFTSRNPGPVAGLDNYAIWIDEGSGTFFSSDLDDFASVDGLYFATAESSPDNLVTLVTNNRQIVLIGTKTTELWYDAGISGFPFERVPGGLLELGGAAKFGVTCTDNTVFMLAADRTARRLAGNVWQRISQHGVEEKWRDYSRVDDCICFSFTSAGHLFVGYTFPTAGKSWVYDITSREWHERESQGGAWAVSAACEYQGVTYVQDALTGSVGVLDATVFTEWGNPIRAEWTYAGVFGGGRRVFHHELELGVETGVGLVTGQGSDPLVTLQCSDDGGRTWVTVPVRSIGKQGEYKKRVRWFRLGSAVHRVYRMSFSDPVPLTIWDTLLDAA